MVGEKGVLRCVQCMHDRTCGAHEGVVPTCAKVVVGDDMVCCKTTNLFGRLCVWVCRCNRLDPGGL